MEDYGRKGALELHAVQYFIAAYNRSHNVQLQFVELRQPPEPDALCLLDGNDVGIEVTHLYGSELDAKRTLGRLRPDVEQEQANRLKPLRRRVIDTLNHRLSRKAKTTYSRSPVWLLVRNAFPLWTRADFEQHADEILVPENHPFQHIWLLTERDGELLQLC